MDQTGKKIQCCNVLRAQVLIYEQIGAYAGDADLATMNEAADRAIAEMKAAFDTVIARGGNRGRSPR